jgi:hypothetical protein
MSNHIARARILLDAIVDREGLKSHPDYLLVKSLRLISDELRRASPPPPPVISGSAFA